MVRANPPANHPTLARRGLLLVLSAPSGTGKTSIARAVLERDPHITMSVSATTRPPRPGEVDGKDYHFVSIPNYFMSVARGHYLEYARIYDHFYGTPKAQVEQHLANGMDVLFDIDWQGTQRLAEKAGPDLVSIFILPPSEAELAHRLKSRGTDSPEIIQARMDKASVEISHWFEYQYVVINTDLDRTVQSVLSILRAERLKRDRQLGISAFIQGLNQ